MAVLEAEEKTAGTSGVLEEATAAPMAAEATEAVDMVEREMGVGGWGGVASAAVDVVVVDEEMVT